MPRDIPVGNGTFLITFDQDYCLRDIYYPCVGKENHTDGHKFRFGIWVDGSPTYPGVKSELLYCARGKSSSPRRKSGCNCGTCDVWDKYDLTGFYFCIEGAAE